MKKPRRQWFRRGPARQQWSKISLALLAVLVAGSLGDALQVNRLLRNVAGWLLGSPARELAALPSAPGYSAVLQRQLISGIADPQGLSFSEDSGTLFTAELDVCGNVLRRISVEATHQLEEVTALSAALKLVTLANRPEIMLLSLRDGEQTADLSNAVQLDVRDGEMPVEAEEIAWDARGNRLFFAASDYPPRVYMAPFNLAEWIKRSPGVYRLAASEWIPAKSILAFMPDISALAYSPARGKLLLLSDETREIVAFDNGRRAQRYLHLEEGSAGLEQKIRSPEGMAIAGDASLYLISDPDHVFLYRFFPEVGLGRQGLCQVP
jgi:uncharacterized protein YjiK